MEGYDPRIDRVVQLQVAEVVLPDSQQNSQIIIKHLAYLCVYTSGDNLVKVIGSMSTPRKGVWSMPVVFDG
jgi:hypothetical protein